MSARSRAARVASSTHPLPSRRLTRRGLLGSAAGAALLAACAPPAPPTAARTTRALPADRSATERRVAFASWTQYLDQDERTKRFPTLDEFVRATGIQVSYTEEIDDNDLYVNKIAPQLRAGQDIGRDLIVLSDWMVNRVIAQELVQPLELIRMPHAGNLRPELMDAPFDPGRHYSLPWQSGLTGIGYDASRVKPIRTIADLWRPDLKGKVVALSEWRDTLGVILRSQGVDPAGAFTRDQVAAAVEVVDRQLRSGQIRRIRGNSYAQDLQSGNALAGLVWSGDIATLRAETGNEHWTFVMPESGGMLWSDNAVVPITSPHRRNAQRLLDWYYQPQIAARVAAWVSYICPVAGAQQAMEKVDPGLVEDPLIFPTADFLARQTSVFRALDPQEEADYAAMWTKVVGQ
ncbi:polyamine ABC transporter substrate-binding protein [Arsenicicoccus sp. oral taxon 190]|uniref:polyamine ABC transporter substrate-binding protein n=1 Tax=Arsenicicoccus sp. oral taxon 190 TaxID=1658671 RepID=UPI000679EB7B|nr:spermidine/putrescine ABC transporter substrate-binding protein [Arsenicicoccus sp. oral taxon 190]AKT52225.1 polyamine ABC transporter substrate-binding protein [Arsenicicoccus sp. oral taxon 190]